MHTVRTFENSGVAGIHIEDQVFPKRASYHAGLEHVIPLDEFLEKIKYGPSSVTDDCPIKSFNRFFCRVKELFDSPLEPFGSHSGSPFLAGIAAMIDSGIVRTA